MQVKYHLTFSAVLSGGLYGVTRSWELSVASFLSGLLIDIDHVIDYLFSYGRPFNIRLFFESFSEHGCYERAFYILHGWEWLVFWTVIGWVTGWNLWTVGVLIGFGQHMILDQLGNNARAWSYSLYGRWKRKFEYRRCFPE
jgi:hypothetical protein